MDRRSKRVLEIDTVMATLPASPRLISVPGNPWDSAGTPKNSDRTFVRELARARSFELGTGTNDQIAVESGGWTSNEVRNPPPEQLLSPRKSKFMEKHGKEQPRKSKFIDR